MKTKEDILYLIINYCLNVLKPNQLLEVEKILIELELFDYVADSDDFLEELKYLGYAEILEIKGNLLGITRIKINGKEFAERYRKEKINSKMDLPILEEAISKSEKLKSVFTHLESANKYLKSSEDSDYRTSIKEAISAVESTVRLILENEKISLGEGLKKLNTTIGIHPAFEKGISALYGFNSDAGGIRHGLKKDDYIPSYNDAKFLVSIYGAFVSYLIERFNFVE